MSFYDWLYNFDQKVNAIAWGWPTIILILGAGLVLSIGIKFAQFGHFGHMMKNTIGAIGKAKKTDDKGEKIGQDDPVRNMQQGHLDIVRHQGKEDAGSRRKKEKEDEKRQELPERIQQKVLETPFLHIFLYVHQRGMRTISG